MLIRPAVPDDAQAIAEAHVRAWRETYRGIMPDKVLDELSVERSAGTWAERLRVLPGRQAVAVAVDPSGLLVGFAVCGPARDAALTTEGEIYAINLVNEAKRKRAGARLMHAMAEALIASGFRDAGLWVLERNTRARAFYDRLGGVASARHERDFGATKLAEIGYMWRDIADLRRSTVALLGD